MSKGSTPRPMAVGKAAFDERWEQTFAGVAPAPRDSFRLVERHEGYDRWGTHVVSEMYEVGER